MRTLFWMVIIYTIATNIVRADFALSNDGSKPFACPTGFYEPSMPERMHCRRMRSLPTGRVCWPNHRKARIDRACNEIWKVKP